MHPNKLLKSKLFLPLVGTLLMLCGCQQLQQLQEMHDATEKMQSQLGGMSDTMNTVSDSGRQYSSLDIRVKLFDDVIQSPQNDEKLTNCAIFFESYEYQVWSLSGEDLKPDHRDKLLTDAMEEFFNHVQNVSSKWGPDEVDIFAKPSYLWQKEDLADTDNQKAVFNMLAASLHKKNRKEMEVAEETHAPDYSTFDLIENALLANKKIAEGKARIEDYPPYVDQILQTPEQAERLIRVRYSSLGLVLIARVIPIAEDLWEGFLYKIWGKKWDFNMDNLTISQLRFYDQHMTEAEKARKLLVELGETPVLDADIKKIFSHMNLIGDEETNEKEDKELREAKRTLRKDLNAYISGD